MRLGNETVSMVVGFSRSDCTVSNEEAGGISCDISGNSRGGCAISGGGVFCASSVSLVGETFGSDTSGDEKSSRLSPKNCHTPIKTRRMTMMIPPMATIPVCDVRECF